MLSSKTEPTKLVSEFIAALDCEIKESKSEKHIKIENGKFLRQTADGFFLYSFETSSKLNLSDETHVKVIVNDIPYEAWIVSFEEPKVVIGFKEKVKENAKENLEGTLKVDLVYLLKLLKQKFKNSSNQRNFSISKQLFSGYSATVNSDYSLTFSNRTLNPSQIKAVQNSFTNTLAIIWGPPGTGKTHTLAAAVEAHLGAGRTVLLLAHANTAVDEALEDVMNIASSSDSLLNKLYREGKIIRLGVCFKENLEKTYPLVVLNNIIKDHPEVKNLSSQIEALKDRKKAIGNSYARKVKQKIDNEIERISQKIRQRKEKVGKKVINEAQLIATTLTKTFSDQLLDQKKFDVLVLDEASMAPLPHLYWAATLTKMMITVAGDFNQLSPICQSDDELAKKWLKRNIFNVLQIDKPNIAVKDKKVSLLNEQYRMAPEIALLANALFYDNLLQNAQSVNNNPFKDSFTTSECQLILVDPYDCQPWACHRFIKGNPHSRFNIYTAFITAEIVKKLALNHQLEIGIISPYRPQVELIAKILKDYGCKEQAKVSTIHSFQGGEADIIVLDFVESPGINKKSMLANEDASLLLNVALTRAKSKLFLVANTSYLKDILELETSVNSVIKHFEEKAHFIPSSTIVKDCIYKSDPSEEPCFIFSDNTDIYENERFWFAYEQDVTHAHEELFIVSPKLSIKRCVAFSSLFEKLAEKDVSIKVVTEYKYCQEAASAIKLLEESGAEVIKSQEINKQNLTVIDRKIIWYGNLPLLGQNLKTEKMYRFIGKAAASQIVAFFDFSSKG